jgi:hypothetical protein
MAWYVFALVDRAPRQSAGRGFSAPLSFRPVAGAFAATERRADVPPAEFGVLKRHNAIVARLAKLVPAILPVRFGTLLESDELDDRLSDRDDELADALALVRNRVQFTWRVKGRGARTWAGRPSSAERRGMSVKSGAEYLRRAVAASRPSPPAAYRPIRTALAPFVAAQRYQPGTGSAPDAFYHLVDARHVRRYLTAAARVLRNDSRLSLTGPWPPFAFAPETL